MADLTRAEDLVHTIGRDDAFRTEVEAAPTATAKRAVLDAHGYQDVGLDDMRAWVESKGGTLIVHEGGRELSDDELAAVAGGLDELTVEEQVGITVGIAAGSVAIAGGIVAAIAAV